MSPIYDGPSYAMRLRIVSYVLSAGGGARFTAQLLKALQEGGGIGVPEFVSHGTPLADYRALFRDNGIACEFRDIPPNRNRDNLYECIVPRGMFEDCDVVWFPWIHGHRIPAEMGGRTVGSFHDAIMFTDESWMARYPAGARRARDLTGDWLASPATLICSSRHWENFLKETFDCAPDRLHRVALAADHALAATKAEPRPHQWPWLSSPFLLCPAGISSHKNHRTLFEAYAKAALAWPLVLTGPGSDFVIGGSFPRRVLRSIAVAARLRPPLFASILQRMARDLRITGLIPLGHLADRDYDAVLEQAACVVMPTLSEGGGSFPVEEAVRRGVPVICSDITVLREHMARIGAGVMWFDPRDPGALAAQLAALVRDYPSIKAAALAQVGQLNTRGWSDVAADYLSVFRSVAARA